MGYCTREQTNSLVELDIVELRAGANYNKNIYNSGNSIDGDLSTKWSMGGEQWIEADLGSPQLVKRVDILWQPGNDSRNASFEIQVINDEAGTKSILGVESISDSQIHVNDPIGLDANRVKLYAHNISRNDWNSILEIKVWGNKITNDPNILIHSLTPFESRTIIPIQMQLPDGKWSKPIKFNFDSGVNWQLMCHLIYYRVSVLDQTALPRMKERNSQVKSGYQVLLVSIMYLL